jgi:hypothetical protein
VSLSIAAATLRRLPTVAQLCAAIVMSIITSNSLPAYGEPTTWTTTRFQVFVGAPFMGSNTTGNVFGTANLDDEYEDERPPPSAVADVERAFSEAASWYKRKGFPAPNLETIVETDNGPAYRIYLCNYREGGFLCGYDPAKNKTDAGFYVPLCFEDKTRTRFIYLNWDRVIGTTLGLNETGYQTIAHELMHAIIDNTPSGTPSSCGSTGGWITEAIPDAISFDIANEIWMPQNRYTQDQSDPAIQKRYGYRPYLESLPQRGTVPVPQESYLIKATYTSSSFWRYLADSHSDGWAGLLLTKRKRGAAPGLLDIPIEGTPGWAREVTWLDKGLSGKFNLNLDGMYALFANNFAYRLAPLEEYAGEPARDNLKDWAEKLFDNCAGVDLSTVPKQSVTLDLKRLSGRCIWVGPTNSPGFTQITFSAESQDLSLLEDISIGQPGSTRVLRGITAEKPGSPGWHVASWLDFPQDGSKSSLYVVSNAARIPYNSKQRSITLEAGRPDYDMSMWAGPLPPAAVAPKPQQPRYGKHAKSLKRQQRDTAKQVSEQMTLDKESLNPSTSRSTSVGRRPNAPACREPFKYSPCGPSLGISLSLMPGTYGAPGGANAQGGIAAQAMGGLQAMSQSSMFGGLEPMKELAARVDEIDGSAVNIAIPLIEYGFTGTIQNAAISVDMSGGRTWRAFGPPDASGNGRLTGSVTIEEFTPLFIRGSFMAPLAELEATADGPPVYRRRETVTGTFSSVAPWQSDERVQILTGSTGKIADDVANSMGISAEMVHSMKQQGTFPGGGSAPSGGGGGGGAVQTGECSCECEQRPFADELCELFCEEEFAACDSP